MGKTCLPRGHEVINIVVVQAENCQMGLVVDHTRDNQEIVEYPIQLQQERP